MMKGMKSEKKVMLVQEAFNANAAWILFLLPMKISLYDRHERPPSLSPLAK